MRGRIVVRRSIGIDVQDGAGSCRAGHSQLTSAYHEAPGVEEDGVEIDQSGG